MRTLSIALLLTALAATGCSNGIGSRYYHPKVEQPELPAATGAPSAQQVVGHLNQQASLVRSLEAQDLTITVNEGGLNNYSARGWLFYQKPRNFRLQAEALRSTEADIGSNDQEFWFWFKRNRPPALFHCAYNEFPKVKNLNLPVHPDWVAEALGVQELNPNETYQLRPLGQGGYELVSQVSSPQGQTLYKSIQMATSGPMAGKIVRQRLVEPVRMPQGKTTWQEVWVAEVGEYQNVAGYFVPRRVTLKCPKEKLTLDLKMDGCQVNPTSLTAGGNAGNTFVRPAGMYEEVDLARYAEPQGGASLTRARGQSPRR